MHSKYSTIKKIEHITKPNTAIQSTECGFCLLRQINLFLKLCIGIPQRLLGVSDELLALDMEAISVLRCAAGNAGGR